LQVNEWPGKSTPVLLLHATGFHSRCWDSIARLLGDTHIFAVDMRFHGGSDRHGEVDWQLMAGDVEQLLDRLELKNLVGVGHSMGGYLLAYAAASRQANFKQLILIDPVILPPDMYPMFVKTLETMKVTDSPVSRRKNRWQDAAEMYQRFRNRAPFDTWQDQVLRDYCDYALRAVPDESSLQLACDPLHEAAIYLNHKGNEAIHDLLPNLDLPVTVMRARHVPGELFDFSTSPTWPELANAMPQARDIYLPHLSHFIPMEAPELVADIIQQAMDGNWKSVPTEAARA
jgi:pimeloyl-ACP methyl ester carboxylesterase